MSNSSFVPGDVVLLKSGGPQMTIKWVEDGNAYCEWFDGNANKGAQFSVVQLEKSSASVGGIRVV